MPFSDEVQDCLGEGQRLRHSNLNCPVLGGPVQQSLSHLMHICIIETSNVHVGHVHADMDIQLFLCCAGVFTKNFKM